MYQEEMSARAFIPNQETVFEVGGDRRTLYKDVIYLIPHSIALGYVMELLRMGRGRVI